MTFITSIGFALFLAIGLASGAESRKPNIVLIMTDDMGWMDLHVQGNEKLRTPHLDRLARESVRFTSAYAASPVCSPTRGALMTGLAPARLHITQHGADTKRFWPDDRVVQPPETSTRLPAKSITIAERLKAVGYATGFFGKWHLGEDEVDWPMSHGFDINVGGCGFGGPPTYWDPYRIPTLEPREKGEYLSDRLADEAISWMRKNEEGGGGPMFVCLWTYNPHYPFEAPKELVEQYEGKEGPGLKNPIYGGQIEATDRAIGLVLGELDRRGMREETLVMFTSDNGGWSGATDNRPLREGKGHIYEGGLRVPLMIRWPGVSKAGEVEHTAVVTMDLAATVLDAAGVALQDGRRLDGESLRPLLTGGGLERDALFFHYPHWAFHKANRPASAIRIGPHKVIRFYDDDSVELYHLGKDLAETSNLAPTEPKLAKTMRARLDKWLEDTEAGLPVRIESKEGK